MTDPGEPPYELSTGDQVCSACGLVVWSDAVEHYLTARQKLYLHS